MNSAYSFDRVTTITHTAPGVPTPALATYTYSYDPGGRVTHETNAEGGVTCAYDATDQVTAVTGARAESFGFDQNGNRNTAGYIAGPDNQYAATPGLTDAYDGEGNLISKR